MSPIRSLLLLLAISAAGCIDSPTGISDRTSLLIGRWTTVTFSVTSRVDSTAALLSFADVITFHQGGAYTVGDRFDSTIVSPVPGTWRLTSNGAQLVLDAGTSHQGVWSIVGLTATDLRMTARLNVDGVLADVDYSARRN